MTESEYRRFIRRERAEGLAAIRAMSDDVLAGWGMDPAEIRRQEQAIVARKALVRIVASTAPVVKQIAAALASVRRFMGEHDLTVEDLVLAGPEE